MPSDHGERKIDSEERQDCPAILRGASRACSLVSQSRRAVQFYRRLLPPGKPALPEAKQVGPALSSGNEGEPSWREQPIFLLGSSRLAKIDNDATVQ